MSFSKDDPYQTSITNDNRSDDWTCCACLHELGNIGEGTHTCPNCDAKIKTSLIEQPCCETELIEED